MIGRWGWQRLSALAGLLALLGCGEATRAGASATGGRAASDGGANAGGAHGGRAEPESGGNAGLGAGSATGGSAGSGGEPGGSPVTDVEGIIGESFVNGNATCLRFLKDAVDGAEADCTSWVFHFRAAGPDSLELVAYRDSLEPIALGHPFSRVSLERQADAWVLANELTLSGSTPNDDLELNGLRFRFDDQDGDGRADALLAEGPGSYLVGHDDYWDDFPIEYSFRGVPDRKGPALAANAEASPAQFPRWSASEPLAEGSHATLTIGAEVIALKPELEAGVVRAFSAARLLLPERNGDLRVEGSDLAGNPIDARSSVSVGSVPALASADFESDAPFFAETASSFCSVNAQSGPRESYDALGALEGRRSFLVAWGNYVLLHLKRPANTSTLRLSLRVLSWNAGSGPSMGVSVLGGTRIERDTPEIALIEEGGIPAGGTRLLGDQDLASDVFADAARDLVFTLTEEGEDVLVSIDALHASGGDPCSDEPWTFSVGAWLDDLRFE
jgi:hypothetical protein